MPEEKPRKRKRDKSDPIDDLVGSLTMNQMRAILRNVFIDFQTSPQDFAENHRRIFTVIKGKRWVTTGLAGHAVPSLEEGTSVDPTELTAGPRRLTDRERSAFLADLRSALSTSMSREDEARVVADAAVLDYPNSPECTPSERDTIKQLVEKLSASMLTEPITGTYRSLRLFDRDVYLDQAFHLVAVRPSRSTLETRSTGARSASTDVQPGPQSPSS
jgi:hypothetical protein